MTHPFTTADDVKWYRGALQAIADMKVNKDTDFQQLTALCIATAQLALGVPVPAGCARCGARRESSIHATESPNAEIRMASHPYQEAL